MHRHIVFDFDGTIIDSQHAKDQIFLDLAGPDRQLRSETLDLLRSRKLTRNELVASIYDKRNLSKLGTSLWTAQAKVSEQLDNVVMSMPLRPHCQSVLEICSEQRRFMYVSSATPVTNLVPLLRNLNIVQFFEIISGAPCTKIEFLRELKRSKSISGKDILVIGDGFDDMESAVDQHCNFICVGERPIMPSRVINLTLAQLYSSLETKSI